MGFGDKLLQAAEQAAAHPPVSRVRPTARPTRAASMPAAALSRGSLPLLVRSLVDHAGLARTLDRLGAGAAAGKVEHLVALAEEALKGRAVASLSATERARLVDGLRAELVKSALSTEQRRQRLLSEAKRLFSAEAGSALRLRTVPVEGGGTWIFFWSESAGAPVIWGESFFPVRAGAPLPARPSLNGLFRGRPRWRTSNGSLVEQPPALPPRPVSMPSGLDQRALDEGPEAVLDEMTRARESAMEAASRLSKPVALRGSPSARRAGERIASIVETWNPSTSPARAWDRRVVAEGVTGPEVTRLPTQEMDAVLPRIGELTDDPDLLGMARLHVFGPIFGDETLVGLAYGPHEAANLLASAWTEGFARFGAKRMGAINVKAGTPVTVTQYIQNRAIKGAPGRYPFVVSVKYEYTLEDGKLWTAGFDISPSGQVSLWSR